MKFVFPSHALNPKLIDDYFKPQAEVLAPDGYGLFSLEETKLFNVNRGDCVMYRGWMLSAADYERFNVLLNIAGAYPFTSVDQYVNTHYLPFWYNAIKDMGVTPETQVYPLDVIESHPNGVDEILRSDFERLRERGWEKFFLKDWVKSLKTAGGSAVKTVDEAYKVIELMKQYRGDLEGGLCVRKFEEGLHDEMRYFVLNKLVYAPGIRNSIKQADADLAILNELAQRIDSPFFSVDMAYNAARPRVVEIGDGQVSDLVGNWTPEFFATLFNKVLA